MTYKLKPLYEEKILSFFSDLFEYNRDVHIIVLDDEEYSRKVDKKSDACNFPEVFMGNPKAENLTERLDKVVWKIYVRKYKDGVNIKDLIHEFLHVYCPKLSEKEVEDATVVFTRAFECYELLYDQQPLKDFFIELCKEVIFKWSGIKKPSLGQILRYDKELIKSVKSVKSSCVDAKMKLSF
jgi:hypothetical protein